jgi:UDP-N-acetylglucosamine--N-acetylmuramyl-(pentapeptide) pyrophosphoryl-undecaprenol N-acetylglucosamine transferase
LGGILYCVSPIGLGHATRAVAVGLKLKQRGLEVEFASGGKAAGFLASYGFKTHDVVTEPTPDERNGVMQSPSLWYIRYWRGYRRTSSRMRSLIERTAPELVVGDEEFSSVSLAIEMKLEQVLISDELELGFARSAISRYVEKRVSRWYTELQHSVSHLLVPDFGTDHDNVHFTTPVVREVTKPREQVLQSLGLDGRVKMILLSASGSGIGEFLLESTLESLRTLKIQGAKLVVTGLRVRPPDDSAVYLGTYRDNQDLVAAADLVISTAGKSTMDEAASYGSPLIAIPIKNHSEQERNAATLGFSFEDRSRLSELIPNRLGRRLAPKDYRGADSIAAYLHNLL